MDDKIEQPAAFPADSEFDIGSIPIAGGIGTPPSRVLSGETGPRREQAAKESGSSQPFLTRRRARTEKHGSNPAPNPDGSRRREKYSLPYRMLSPALIMIGLVLAYLFISQLFVALFIPRLLADHFGNRMERSVTIARAEWRPLAMVLVLHNGIVGPRPHDSNDRVDPLLSFRTLRADLRPTALLSSMPLIGELQIEQPFLHLLRSQDGSYNLSWPRSATLNGRWLPPETTIVNGRLLYTDLGYQPPSQPVANPTEFIGELREINGGWRHDPKKGSAGLFHLDLRATGEGEALCELRGRLVLPDPTASGDLQLTIKKLPLTGIAAYLKPLLAHEINDGHLTIQARFSSGPGSEFHIDQDIEIKNLRLGRELNHPTQGQNLKLLQALLSDRDRIIRLNLPLTIRTDRADSSYPLELAASLASLREQARLTPLSLLAKEYPALVEQVEFPPGDSELSRDAGRHLDQLATALGGRPLLKLEISGRALPGCDLEALRAKREVRLRDLRRQAVATLARELAGGGGTTVTAEQIDSLRPENIVIGEKELLELATARQQAVRGRLAMAMGIVDKTTASNRPNASARLLSIPPAPDQTSGPATSGCSGVTLKFIP